MANDVGLKVVEGVANGLTPFQEPAKRNIGLIMERERGVPNTPIRVSSLSDDRLYFGGHTSTGYGATVVRNLFKNAKDAPVVIYGVRIVGSSAVASTVATTIDGIAVEYTAGQLGQEDPGAWGDDLTGKFYSYDYKVRNKYAFEVYYKGNLVESFEAATCAALQSLINSSSYYMIVDFAAEVPLPSDASGTGTITTSLTSTTVTGVGTAFTTQVKVGTIIKNGAGATVGIVKSIASNTSLTLEENAAVVIAGAAFKYYLRYSQSNALANGVSDSPDAESSFYPNTDPTSPAGLACFNGVDVQIIASTEYHTSTMAVEGRNYCEGRKDCIYVANLPLNPVTSAISDYSTALQQTGPSFIAAYNGWVKTSDENGGYETVPALGCVLGAAYLRVPYLQGDGIHIPPGGIDSAFVDVVEVYPKLLTQDQLNQYTREYTINSIVYRDRVGWFVMTSRTMATDSKYHSVHIRMQTSYYSRVLVNNLGWAIQKPNTPELKKEIYVSLYGYFLGEYNKGALERSVDFKTACNIICDQTNNPLSGDRKQLRADIEWIPTEAAEAIKLALNRNDGILVASETV